MILGLQIIAIIFSFVMIYFSILNYKRREITKTEMYSWVIIWIITLLAVIFPQLLREYARKFAVTRLFDLMVVGGFILVITMSAYAYLKCRKLEKKIEDFVRKEAIKNFSKTAKKK